MKSTAGRFRMATALLTLTLGMSPLVPSAAVETTLGEQHEKILLNTAVSQQYYGKVIGKTTEGACFFDPEKPANMGCNWRWSDSDADASWLRQKVEEDAAKWCEQSGGESCIELYRNGTLTYDGLSPDQTQRLEEILAGIPSYDHEATPLPKGSTIGPGLFHERFAQTRWYWKQQRKKQKRNANYVMCANELGAGVEFYMRSSDKAKDLPHVRSMCILQCQAVAQAESKEGKCYTLFENDKFTSPAARRTMQLKVKRTAAEVRDAFVGAWKGINHIGSTIETAIERVKPNGKVRGARCTGYPNGSFAWSTLDDATFVNGDRITLMNGNRRVTLMMDATQGEAPETVLTWPWGWQFRIPMESMSTRGCNERFLTKAAGVVPERQTDDGPIVGAWSGKRKDGTIQELAVESVGDNGALTGRYCTKYRHVLLLWDIAADGPFKGTLNKKGETARMTIPWNNSREELEFTMNGKDRMTMKLTVHRDANQESVTSVKMKRGAKRSGCLRRTTQSPSQGQG